MNKYHLLKRQIPAAQQGSVMLVALVFLVLTSLIAMTTMNTSILEVRMAGNNQFKEEAMQIAEGISDDIMNHHDSANGETLPLFTSTKQGDLFCQTDAVDPNDNCAFKSLYITSPDLLAAIGSVPIVMTAEFLNDEVSGYGSAETAGNNLTSYFKLDVRYNGAEMGLSQTHMSFGLQKVIFIGENDVKTPKNRDGEDLGRFQFF